MDPALASTTRYVGRAFCSVTVPLENRDRGPLQLGVPGARLPPAALQGRGELAGRRAARLADDQSHREVTPEDLSGSEQVHAPQLPPGGRNKL